MLRLIEKISILDNEGFENETIRNANNRKRLLRKNFEIDKKLNDLDLEIKYLQDNLNEDQTVQKEYILKNHILGLRMTLEEMEKVNIQLEQQCLGTGKHDETPLINDIIEEFLNKYLEEKTKNKKIGLYIKKEFINSKTEEIDKIKKEIHNVELLIQKENERIRELRQNEDVLLQNLSILEKYVYGNK